MQEIIVVENKAFLNKTDFVCIEDIVKDLKVEYKIEKYPTNWEELKELCINLKRDYDITCVSSTIWVHGLSFNETGIIGDSHHSFIVEDRTPQQMWAIIKNLIGEE